MAPVSTGHYENFPVASLLCPPALRAPVRAIYRFARTADDLADEGQLGVDARRALLMQYRACLHQIGTGAAATPWPQVFGPLCHVVGRHALPLALLDDLLDAFLQDTANPRFDNRDQLLDYCRRSANPIGRLLLHLYGVNDPIALAQSDAICSALQLINFWQDASVDLPCGRNYFPADDAHRHGVWPDALRAGADSTATQALVRDLSHWAAALMRQGAPLAWHLHGRIGWELRLVVQGGLRVLEIIAAMHYRTLSRRPIVGRRDLPLLLWRAWRMTASAGTARRWPRLP